MLRWTNNGALDMRRVAALLDIVGPQGLELAGVSYTLFGLTARNLQRAIAVPDHDARPIVLALDFDRQSSGFPAGIARRRDEDRLSSAYVSNVEELIRRLVVQADQTAHAFEEALGLWLDTGLLLLRPLAADVSSSRVDQAVALAAA
jgi:hypothetical protein